MSGFSPDWLAARESWDHLARSPEILARLEHWLAERRGGSEPTGIVDLGCGTGSTWRYLTANLSADFSATARWTLVDGDQRLLDIAAASGPEFGITSLALDLRETDIDALLRGNDLVTTSALLDLVSEAWLDRLWRAVESCRVGLLAGLTYDGRLAFTPAHPLDAVVRDLVNRHQRGDKGFGPALGPDASSALARRGFGAGWHVRTRRSDWILTAQRDGPGLAMLIDGWVGAATEMAPGMAATLNAWRAERLAATRLTVVVGHRDQLVLPPSPAQSG